MDSVENYQSVPGLPFVSKVAERIVARQLKQHIETNNLLDKHQSAYCACYSIETALIKVQNCISQAVDNDIGYFLMLLDLSDGVETIDQ